MMSGHRCTQMSFSTAWISTHATALHARGCDHLPLPRCSLAVLESLRRMSIDMYWYRVAHQGSHKPMSPLPIASLCGKPAQIL